MEKIPYQNLKRFIAGISIFSLIIATTGMAIAGNRINTIVCYDALLILSLSVIGRIIIWCWASWEQVRGGVQVRSKR